MTPEPTYLATLQVPVNAVFNGPIWPVVVAFPVGIVLIIAIYRFLGPRNGR